MIGLHDKMQTEKMDKIEQMKNEINSISKKDMINYLNLMKEKKLENGENEVDDESIIDKSINEILS